MERNLHVSTNWSVLISRCDTYENDIHRNNLSRIFAREVVLFIVETIRMFKTNTSF